jgi:putative phage-type endonuclease
MINLLLDLIIQNSKETANSQKELVSNVTKLCKICIPMNITRQTVKNRIKQIEIYKECLNKLFSAVQFTQRTPEWYNERYNMITASDSASALNEGKFESQKDFVVKKCSPLVTKSTFDLTNEILSWGVKYESIASNIYSKRNNVKIHEFGLIKHSDPELGFFGASPDGITENGIMLEIKCPWKRKIDGSVPGQYYAQIQGQLDVCDLEECDYLECAFVEYYSKQSYFDDTDESGIYTVNMYEKGIFYELEINDTIEYIYSPFLCDNETLQKWVNETEDSLQGKNYKIKYWYLKEYHCKRVYRNNAYFNTMIKKLRVVWNKILEYRKNNELYTKEVINKRKKQIIDFEPEKKYGPALVLSTFAFLPCDN